MFHTGNFSTFIALKGAVENSLIANGWNRSADVMSKSGVFVKLITGGTGGTGFLQAVCGTGQTGSEVTGTHQDMILRIVNFNTQQFNFPATYELHVFDAPDEVFLVVNYNSDRYQQMSFGRSNVEGVGGTGAWATASCRDSFDNDPKVYLSQSQSQAGSSYSGQGLGLFFEEDSAPRYVSWAHTGLDTEGWRRVAGDPGSLQGSGSSVGSLLASLPSQFNQANVLLPLTAAQKRLDNGLTLVVSMENARLCRIDNILPGQIISFGPDSWKVYPFHRKNADQRNGVPWGTGADHTGTFGYAIRYQGA